MDQQTDKAKEDNASKCNNCQKKYVEASAGWVGCSFCDTWYAKIVKGVLRFKRRSVQQIPINKIKSIRLIKYIYKILYNKHPFICFWQLLLPSYVFLCIVLSPYLIIFYV